MLKSRNIYLMYTIHVVGGLLFFLPIFALYLEKNLFTITNVGIVLAVQAIAIALLEIPTGTIADLFGRKRTLILSQISCLIGLVFLYIGKNMVFFILFALFNALARSLTSGTDSAIIYDTLKDEKREHLYKKIYGTYHAFWPLGAVIGSLLGGYLATFSLSLPVLYTFIPISIALILSFLLVEPNYKKEKHKNMFKHIAKSAKIIIKDYHLILLFLTGFIFWGIDEATFNMKSLFLDFKTIPIIYFGVISAFVYSLSSLGHYFSHSFSEKVGNKNTLVIAAIATPIFLLLATLTNLYIAAIFWVCKEIFFGLKNPVESDLINREVQSSERATVVSCHSFFSGTGIAIFSLILGYYAELYNINIAFKISALIMFIAPLLYLFIKDKK